MAHIRHGSCECEPDALSSIFTSRANVNWFDSPHVVVALYGKVRLRIIKTQASVYPCSPSEN